LCQVEELEAKAASGQALSQEESAKVARKQDMLTELAQLGAA
jgi:hypothetical protein